VRRSLVSQEVTGVDKKSRNLAESLLEFAGVADTPCQSPEAGRFSATGFKGAVNIPSKVQDEKGSVVGAKTFTGRYILSYDLESLSILQL
jgi:hypothetical protein